MGEGSVELVGMTGCSLVDGKFNLCSIGVMEDEGIDIDEKRHRCTPPSRKYHNQSITERNPNEAPGVKCVSSSLSTFRLWETALRGDRGKIFE